MENDNRIALIDMDGTLVDYDSKMIKDLNSIKAPHEEPITDLPQHLPDYLNERKNIISKQTDWWFNLPKLVPGWDILRLVRRTGFKTYIYTKGPMTKPNAWSEKLRWCHKHFPEMDGMMVVSDKGLTYGRVLVDDYPDYVLSWLKNRPRGLVIMPPNSRNKNFKHPNVIRYDMTNETYNLIEQKLKEAYER